MNSRPGIFGLVSTRSLRTRQDPDLTIYNHSDVLLSLHRRTPLLEIEDVDIVNTNPRFGKENARFETWPI